MALIQVPNKPHNGQRLKKLCAAGVLQLFCREAEALGVGRAYCFQPVTEGAIKLTP